jgi:hypothetical protein
MLPVQLNFNGLCKITIRDAGGVGSGWPLAISDITQKDVFSRHV